MRASTSLGLALILVVGGALWLGTGLYVQGGLGPHDSEMTVTQKVEGSDGPLSRMVEASGAQREVEHKRGTADPALSIAERNTLLAGAEASARSVRTRLYALKMMPMEVTLRGHTQSPATREAVARTADTVAEVFVAEGQRVAAGDPVCTLSSGNRSAAVEQAAATVAQAEAALEKARIEYNTNEKLRRSGISSQNSAESYRAALKLAEANFSAAEVALTARRDELAYTRIVSSAAGVVQRPVAKVGDLIGVGSSCAKIVQLDPMRFAGAVPQAFIQHAHRGLKASIRTIDGQTAEGEITYVAVTSDPATRTYEVEIEFSNPGGKILDGMTAEALIRLGEVPAHLLPQSALTLASDGTLGVQLVVDGKASFRRVTILNDTPQGIWLAGLPDNAEVIVIGQEYVVDGQPVAADRQD